MSKQDDRSEAALHERLEIAEAAAKAHDREWGVDIRPNLRMAAVCAGNGEPLCMMTDDEDVVTAAHIALNDPGTTRNDIEEILRLRAENERLRGEVARLDKEADWFIEYIWNKDIFRCPMPEGYRCEHRFKHVCCLDSEDTEIRGRCWREVARKAVEEQND